MKIERIMLRKSAIVWEEKSMLRESVWERRSCLRGGCEDVGWDRKSCYAFL